MGRGTTGGRAGQGLGAWATAAGARKCRGVEFRIPNRPGEAGRLFPSSRCLLSSPPPQSSSRPIDKLPRHSGRLALAGWLDNRPLRPAGWSIKIPTALLLTCAEGKHVAGSWLERAIPSFLSCLSLSLRLIDFDGPRQVPALSVTECGDHPMETRETNQAATSSPTGIRSLSLSFVGALLIGTVIWAQLTHLLLRYARHAGHVCHCKGGLA